MHPVIQLRAEAPGPFTGRVIPLPTRTSAPMGRGLASRCSHCSMRPMCLASGLDEQALSRLEGVLGQWRLVYRGEYLFRNGDQFKSLYTLRSGSFKTVAGHEDGVQHVTGYILPGDMLGLGAIGEGQYDCDAIALEDSTVCVMPFASLEALCREMHGIQLHLHQLLSREIVRESRQMVLLGGMTAERRVAAFLLNVSHRLGNRGYATREFNLRMTREEIGSFLGIKLETVSRTFSRFQRDGLIRVDGKQIELLDRNALADI